MAKAKIIIETIIILGFMLILFGTLVLILGAFKNNNTLLLVAFIPLGLGILVYMSLIILVLIKMKRKK